MDKVMVKTCESAFEAIFIRDYLRNDGIRAWDSSELMPAWTGRYALISRGFRVFVHPADAQRAMDLLAHPPDMEGEFSGEEGAGTHDSPSPAAEAPPETLIRCPNCGSARVSLVQMPWPVWILVNVLFFGLPALFYRPSWICRDCDWDSTRRM